MKIFLGADHGGFALKSAIFTALNDKGDEVIDMGNSILDNNDDYVDFAIKVANAVKEQGSAIGQDKVMGVLMCRSAAGMVIAANKIKGVRAVAAFDKKSAMHSRQHNDANVLALSGDWLDKNSAIEVLNKWLSTPFSGEPRHVRRLKKILEIEQ